MMSVRGLFAAGTWALLAATLLPTSAHAQWHYCLAPSDGRHAVYLSAPLWSSLPMDELETSYRALLLSRGLSYSSIQCPKAGDETAARTMWQHTVAFNRQMNRDIVNLDWRP